MKVCLEVRFVLSPILWSESLVHLSVVILVEEPEYFVFPPVVHEVL